jgi:hypothetical protein
MENNSKRWITATTVFFGIMLMPVGIALHMILVRSNNHGAAASNV